MKIKWVIRLLVYMLNAIVCQECQVLCNMIKISDHKRLVVYACCTECFNKGFRIKRLYTRGYSLRLTGSYCLFGNRIR